MAFGWVCQIHIGGIYFLIIHIIIYILLYTTYTHTHTLIVTYNLLLSLNGYCVAAVAEQKHLRQRSGRKMVENYEQSEITPQQGESYTPKYHINDKVIMEMHTFFCNETKKNDNFFLLTTIKMFVWLIIITLVGC